MLDAAEYDRWREAAADARRAAALQGGASLHNWACFLAEQAAQLSVKSLLHGIGAGAWGHDLVALGGRLTEATGLDLPDPVAAALRRLSRHYIPPRYPDAHPGGAPLAHYGPEDAQTALADADAVMRYVDRIWADLAADGAEDTANGG